MLMNTPGTSAKFRVIIAGVAAGVLLVTGCSSGSDDSSATAAAAEVVESTPLVEPTDAAESETKASAEPAVVANPLPVFSSTTLDGQAVTQADFEGKPTIMWFWAPWCSVCRGEAPTLAKVADQLDGNVDVVGVAALGSVDEMKTFVSDTGIENFSQLADPDAQVWGVFGVASQPAFAFISADGSIEVVQGSIDKDAILERAATLS
jgi:thiol-disulfide isomerase/thioredoxin